MEFENFEFYCRLCLGRLLQDHTSIFTSFTQTFENVKDHHQRLNIAEVIAFCVPDFCVDNQDNLPTKICRECLNKLFNFYEFRNQIEHTNHILCEAKINEKSSHGNDLIEINYPVNFDDNKMVCIVCSKKFGSPGRLKSHLIRKHSVRNDQNMEKQFNCDKCDKTYTTLANLRIHKLTHSGDKPFKCTFSQCDRAFYKETSLISHISIHTGLKKYQCDHCQRYFTSANILQQHRKVHSNVRSHQCTQCSRAFFTKKDLTVHEKIHTKELPFLCCQCGKKFSRKTHLNMHLRTHSGEKPFSCEFCNKSFAQSGDLTAHIRIHTGFKPYQCKFCEKTFNQSSGRNAHMKIHTGERVYCRICNKGFTQTSSLKRHLRIHVHSDYSSQEEPSNSSQDFKMTTDTIDDILDFVQSL